MEGPFVTQDHRRVWVHDDNPKPGFHVNAAGTGPGEVHGVRTSLNGIPVNKAIYFCRTRTN